ncbi:MAG: hydrogenase nickel incorporation protein HypB [Planctomycetes bacterium]|nr:hydrogenase nickel incorporation protein HypB [Planctomycetota bacterium]
MHIPVVEKITKANDEIASINRARLDEAGVVALNLMASPGAGKTSLIEKTVPPLTADLRVGVIGGDIATTLDAERATLAGATAVQITTGGACHLDAPMVRRAMEQLPLEELDLLVVENVGNLICPASFDLGTHANVLVASVPEGDDKPFKHPRIYRGVDVLVVNKIDLLPYVDFDMERFQRGVRSLNETLETFELSCRTGDGLAPWLDWVRGRVRTAAPVGRGAS